MTRRLKEFLLLAIFSILLVLVQGCGDGGYETASRLEIITI